MRRVPRLAYVSLPLTAIAPQWLTSCAIVGAPGSLDDVASCMHLAIVISASGYKAASLWWWNAAWSLARKLKLGKEVPVTSPPEPNEDGAQGEIDVEHMNGLQFNGSGSLVDFTEVEREERRQMWWLLSYLSTSEPA